MCKQSCTHMLILALSIMSVVSRPHQPEHTQIDTGPAHQVSTVLPTSVWQHPHWYWHHPHQPDNTHICIGSIQRRTLYPSALGPVLTTGSSHEQEGVSVPHRDEHQYLEARGFTSLVKHVTGPK